MQATLPAVEPREPIGRRGNTFVGDVVGDACISVHRRDVRPHGLRQQPRCDGKVLVVRPCQGLARGVRARERLGPTGHHGILPSKPLMRDVVAGIVAVLLLLLAASLATTLHYYRRRRQRARDTERALGRSVIVEIPGADDLVLFSEDAVRFHYGERSLDKDLVVAVRVLINGAPFAAY